jgi:hypothetical protein
MSKLPKRYIPSWVDENEKEYWNPKYLNDMPLNLVNKDTNSIVTNIKYLLDLSVNIRGSFNKASVILSMFDYLVKHRSFLSRYQRFKITVKDKMLEFVNDYGSLNNDVKVPLTSFINAYKIIFGSDKTFMLELEKMCNVNGKDLKDYKFTPRSNITMDDNECRYESSNVNYMGDWDDSNKYNKNKNNNEEYGDIKKFNDKGLNYGNDMDDEEDYDPDNYTDDNDMDINDDNDEDYYYDDKNERDKDAGNGYYEDEKKNEDENIIEVNVNENNIEGTDYENDNKIVIDNTEGTNGNMVGNCYENDYTRLEGKITIPSDEVFTSSMFDGHPHYIVNKDLDRSYKVGICVGEKKTTIDFDNKIIHNICNGLGNTLVVGDGSTVKDVCTNSIFTMQPHNFNGDTCYKIFDKKPFIRYKYVVIVEIC